MQTSSSSQTRLPTPVAPIALRPDKGGKAGKPVKVRSNFFAIEKLQVHTIWHYHVSITPEISQEKARKLWKIIETFPELAKHKTVFDGTANAYASEELKVERLTRKIELPDEFPSGKGVTPRTPGPSSEAGPSSKGGKGAKGGKGGKGKADVSADAPAAKGPPSKNKNEFTIKIEHAAKIDLSELHRFLNKEGPVTSGCLTAIQALNIVISHKLFSQMVSYGRSAYMPTNPLELGGGLEKWDGVFQSIRPGQGKLYANIDVASTAFVKGGNAAQLMAEVLGARDAGSLRPPNQRDCMELQRHFKGCSFTVSHRGGDFKRRYKVSEISRVPADKVTFDLETNAGQKKRVSIPEYYHTAYNLKVAYPGLPCFGVQGRDGIMFFPAEVCNVVPGRRYLRKLNEIQTTAMLRGTCLKPAEREGKIRQLLPMLDFNRNEYMKGFKMEISQNMTEVPARVLDPPTVAYRGVTTKPQFGAWRMDPSKKMVEGAHMKSWGVLVYDRPEKLRMDVILRFLQQLTSTLAENGMNIIQRAPHIQHAQIGGGVERSVQAMITDVTKKCGSPPELILVIVPQKCQTYSAIKSYCETRHRTGVMTQCALSRHILRADKQYCGNLGLKINAKLGGINSVIDTRSLSDLNDKLTMLIGADVTHPAPGDDRRSIAAVVASMDQRFFKYAGRIKSQESRVEVMADLEDLVHQLLLAFRDRHQNKSPERILFYRDGVSEGQYAEVMREEVMAVKAACRRLGANYNPKITFCVVKKRHHARFFPTNPHNADRSGNCVAGTVVDSMITHPTEFDFYLQSHAGLLGTSRPTLYHVLLDENKFSSDTLQRVTYNLCHVYARCARSVSLVPPVYYAHLLAFRARHYQSELPETRGGSLDEPGLETLEAMKNLMYFV